MDINRAGSTVTLEETPVTGIDIIVAKNGVPQRKTTDYTVTAGVIDFTPSGVALIASDIIQIWYWYEV